MTTACGALDHIVVDSADSATNCINHLKRQNAGRTSFICLEQQPKNNMSPIDTPEGVSRLFDLVKPKDSRYAQAFYNAMRDTLVAKDLDQANRIAFGKKRWRVVTLKGEILEASGTMSGGGSRSRSGGMSSKFQDHSFSPGDIAKLQKELERLENAWSKAKTDLQSKKSQIEQWNEELPQMQVDIQKLQLDVENCKLQKPILEQRLEKLLYLLLIITA